MGSLGLEVGRGGGTRAPAVRGVVGLLGTGTGQREKGGGGGGRKTKQKKTQNKNVSGW